MVALSVEQKNNFQFTPSAAFLLGVEYTAVVKALIVDVTFAVYLHL